MERYVFRGKRLDNREWVEGAYFNGNFSALIFPEIRHTDSSDLYRVFAHEVDPETVGQCTGIRDKSGNLIYEGDVVFFTYNRIGNRTVEWEDGKWSIVDYLVDECVIVGNIHTQ